MNKMNLKINAKKFVDLINAGMVNDLISPVTLTLLKNKLAIIDTTLATDIAVVVLANKDYFDEYKQTGKESIVIEQEFLDRLGNGFKGDITEFSSTTEKITATDGIDTVTGELQEPSDRKFPLPLTPTKYGIIPDSNKYKAKIKDDDEWTEEMTLKGHNIYKTTAKSLKLPKAESYKLSLKDKILEVTIPFTTTNFTHKIEGESIVGKKEELIIDGEYYRNVVSNLSGDVYLVYNTEHVIFLESSENLTKTYAVATCIEAV